MSDTALVEATPLEIATCTVHGAEQDLGEFEATRFSPLAALEASVLAALQRTPCLLSFSGGMDSSFVLAVAVQLARRNGLPLPIPVTWRFSDAPRAEESAWQERVIAALPGLDWQFLHALDELDIVGPIAQRVLTRHGVLLPPNVHLHLPIVDLAAGGSLLTGVGGDQILVSPRGRGRSAALRAYAPGRAVAALRYRQGRTEFPWLRPSASRQVFARTRRERRTTPRAFARRVRWRLHQRDVLMTVASLNVIADDHNVRVVNPLLDRDFVESLASSVPDLPTLSRSAVMASIAGGQLPAVATAPRPKATFLEVFLRAPTRRFVQSWDGRGADESIIDSAVLRELWSRWPIPAGTAGLVQQLWLSSTTAPAAQGART